MDDVNERFDFKPTFKRSLDINKSQISKYICIEEHESIVISGSYNDGKYKGPEILFKRCTGKDHKQK